MVRGSVRGRGLDSVKYRELVGVQHIGGDQEGGFALYGPGDCLVGDGHRSLDLPLDVVGRRALPGTSRSVLLGMRDERGLNGEPLWR